MDAHVFRRVCDELVPLLTGARLEKIQSPAHNLHVFTVFARRGKHTLCLRAERKNPALFLSSEKISVGAEPPASVMRLRKFVGGRRIIACSPDWTRRRLSLLCGSLENAPDKECWLVLDLREGPFLWTGTTAKDASVPVLPDEVRWPADDELADACENWRSWPVVTPALRRTLPHLEDIEKKALLADLEYGGGDVFCYTSPAGDGDAEISAWPLPPELRGDRIETVREDILEAVRDCSAARILGDLTRAARNAAAAPLEKEADRLGRLLKKLDAEHARLKAMCGAADDALVLQGLLWRFPADFKARLLDVPPAEEYESAPVVPEKDEAPREGWKRLCLDARLTLRENVDALFHRAKRGKRGLAFSEERHALVTQQRQAALDAAQRARQGLSQTAAPRKKAAPEAASGLNSSLPKGVQGFMSSDGFAVLRGRDVKGNLAVLRQAAPHDIWLHVEGGPGSHAVIRRDFAGQEVPERTLLEAGALVACKSWQKDSDRANVLYAEARHIKPMRNAAPGMVRIDKVFTTRLVPADPDAETRLAVK